ncbi:LytR family transcriptional regulator [Blastococcus sp. MG754426]|uniref:LytR C-terminal domain-containing protein n=1 Tax=unclassified Blastococcus TaxID=2619396 RepID=UPI001EEF8AAD|nr:MULTISPECIES: LytR C-terminal domain-containing protein [unclassified Blastococcus]MCF6506190.1 LytR family transcriptional regulator [Blastococcus sp. MG754426]MCF6510432.1 LytR family transcriptional regulator [Blastococcus sp. MG754427]MCF6735566.1 LytR family transcriptional regulator [Blastococcus sp. KM273129]
MSPPAGRRRTDAPDGSLPGAGLSDHPTAPGRDRRGPRRDVVAGAPGEAGHQVSRSRLPLPPVPAAARAAAGPAPVTPRAAGVPGPQTSAAPFRAVPSPAPAPAASPAGPTALLVDDEPLATTGPTRGSGRSAPVPRVPRVPRQTTPSGAPSSSYGDWTKPSRTDDTGRSRLAPAVLESPATTAIPERDISARRADAASDDDLGHDGHDDDGHDDDGYDLDAEVAAPAPGGAEVKGGRAAYRAERQAADAARRKAARRNGTPEVLFDDEPERKPRRVLKGLVAMAVVAGAVLGVYTVTAPEKEEAAAAAPAPASVPTVAVPTAALPPLPESPVVVEPAITTPVRVPVTVLNATRITGLAAKISGAVVAGGWESPGVGAYPGTDVSATTVYFTEGDEQQRQAALQLIEQFPELAGPAPRFFEVADVPAPGLVIVATGNWQP